LLWRVLWAIDDLTAPFPTGTIPAEPYKKGILHTKTHSSVLEQNVMKPEDEGF
jgi:hypothetical protein